MWLKAALANGAGVIMLLVAGCQMANAPRHPQRSAPDVSEMQARAEKACLESDADLSHLNCIYSAKLQYAIQRNFYDAKHYAGRECTLTIGYNPRGRYDVLSATGDEQLCKKAWSVVSSAEKLPPPPPGAPDKLLLDFKPGG